MSCQLLNYTYVIYDVFQDIMQHPIMYNKPVSLETNEVHVYAKWYMKQPVYQSEQV